MTYDVHAREFHLPVRRTFTFYKGSTLLAPETLQGPSAAKLREVVEKLDKATNRTWILRCWMLILL